MKPRQSKEVMGDIALYNRKLVVDRSVPTLDRGSFCSLRDGYEIPQFNLMMAQLWRGTYPNWYLYNTHMRDRLSISWRHHLLLRDEDIRNLDVSDCFCEVVDYQLYGTSVPIRGLAICLRGGKVRADKSEFSLALRHNDFGRCPVGAFAFYMFERFHVSAPSTVSLCCTTNKFYCSFPDWCCISCLYYCYWT